MSNFESTHDIMGFISGILSPGYTRCMSFYQGKVILPWRIPAFARNLRAGRPIVFSDVMIAGPSEGSVLSRPPTLIAAPGNLPNPASESFFFSENSIRFYMKAKSRQCPNEHGAIHRCHIRTSEHKIQRWHSIPWQYCPVCKMMLPD